MKLKDEIYKRGYTLIEFCNKAKISRFTLMSFFKGRNKKLRGDTIYLISVALDVPYETVVDWCATRN